MKELPLTLALRGPLPLTAMRGEGRGEGAFVPDPTL